MLPNYHLRTHLEGSEPYIIVIKGNRISWICVSLLFCSNPNSNSNSNSIAHLLCWRVDLYSSNMRIFAVLMIT